MLALVQSRLERLDGDARHMLRAASVFGQQFWRGGVIELVGGTVETDCAYAVALTPTSNPTPKTIGLSKLCMLRSSLES